VAKASGKVTFFEEHADETSQMVDGEIEVEDIAG
jgi:hypothetical protein